MAITRIKNSSIANRTPKYNDVLAGLPFRPVIGTATDGGNGTSVSVAFTGNNVANGTVTYTALSSPGSLTATGTTSPITVTGLTAGTAYTFQVKAGNSLGDSAYSAASNSVTPVDPAAFVSLASTTLSTTTSTVTFSSISSSYQHLQIRWMARESQSGSVWDGIRLRINGDTGSNYSRHQLQGDGSSAASADGTSATIFIELVRAVPQNTITSNIFGVGILDIHDYASTTKNKTIRSFHGGDSNGAGYVNLESGLRVNTAAITSIEFASLGTGFTSGTVFSLYGIKGA